MERKTRTIGLWMLGLFLVSAPAIAGGSCTSAVLNESLTLPDGSRHDAGLLTLCATRDYSPVATLHKTFFDGIRAVSARRLSWREPIDLRNAPVP